MPRKPEKPSLQSIADSLKLSKTTVSLVLKGDGDRYRISRQTQQRIRDYAETVSFEPDFLARALVTKQTMSVGLIFPDLHEAFMSEMLKGIENVLYDEGYSLLLSTSGFNTEYEYRNIKQLLRRRVDGIIIIPYIPLNMPGYIPRYPELILKSGCPAVFADRIPEGNEDLSWIVQDDRDSAYKAVGLLQNHGCRRIGCISFNLSTSSINERIRGYREALGDAGSGYADRYLYLLDSQEEGSGDLEKLLSGFADDPEPPDGLLITTGGLAHRIKYLIDSSFPAIRGIRIAKFGKDPDYFRSGMIQILQPNTGMGRLAAQTLLDLMKQKTRTPVRHIIKSTIVDTEES